MKDKKDCHQLKLSEYKNRKKIPKQLCDDKEVVMKALEVDRMYFFSVSDRLRDDKEVVMKAIDTSTYSDICFKISNRLLDDKDVAIKIMKTYEYQFCVLSNRLKKDEDILNLIDYHSDYNFYHFDFDFGHTIDDPQFFLKLINLFESKFKYKIDLFEYKFKKRIINYSEYLLSSQSKQFQFSILHNASNRIKNDKTIVKRAIELIPESFFDASNKLKIDHEIIKTFINKLQANKIKKYLPNCFELPLKFKYIEDSEDVIKTNELHQNMLKELAIIIIKNKAFLFKSLKLKFKNDKDVILEGIRDPLNIPDIIPYMSDVMKKDSDIKPLLDIKTLKYFSPKYGNDKNFVLKSVKKYNTFRFASKTLRNDKEVVYAALNHSKDPDDVLNYISQSLKNDKNIFLKVIDVKIKQINKTNK